MGQDIMMWSLLVVAAAFGMLAIFARLGARRDRSKRISLAAVAGQARSISPETDQN